MLVADKPFLSKSFSLPKFSNINLSGIEKFIIFLFFKFSDIIEYNPPENVCSSIETITSYFFNSLIKCKGNGLHLIKSIIEMFL